MTGERVKALILEKGYSVAQVAEMIGTSQQNLAANLKHTDVRSGLLERVANALGLNVLEFYGEKAGDAPVLSAKGNRNTQVTQVAGNYSSVSSDANVLELLKMKDEQLSLAMRQTSKAQEQMDQVLRHFLSNTNPGMSEVLGEQPLNEYLVHTVSIPQKSNTLNDPGGLKFYEYPSKK